MGTTERPIGTKNDTNKLFGCHRPFPRLALIPKRPFKPLCILRLAKKIGGHFSTHLGIINKALVPIETWRYTCSARDERERAGARACLPPFQPTTGAFFATIFFPCTASYQPRRLTTRAQKHNTSWLGPLPEYNETILVFYCNTTTKRQQQPWISLWICG